MLVFWKACCWRLPVNILLLLAAPCCCGYPSVSNSVTGNPVVGSPVVAKPVLYGNLMLLEEAPQRPKIYV